MAESIESRQAFVSKYETGKVCLEFLDVVAICDALNISIVKFAELYDASRLNRVWPRASRGEKKAAMRIRGKAEFTLAVE